METNTHVLEKEFPLIPMSEIDDLARKMSVAWMECEDRDWIKQKHKLASDIMNYHRIKSEQQQQRINELEKHLKCLVEGYEQWEADIISDDKLWWPNVKNDAIRGRLYDDMLLLQAKRNEAKQALNP